LTFAIITDRAADGIDSRAQRRFGNDPTGPDGGNQVISADHPVAVADKVFEDVEDLGLNGDEAGIPTQLAPICIQSEIREDIQQFAAPNWPEPRPEDQSIAPNWAR
jgi:hypothetical protein